VHSTAGFGPKVARFVRFGGNLIIRRVGSVFSPDLCEDDEMQKVVVHEMQCLVENWLETSTLQK
jgi:hypothetical protein